MSKTIVVTIMVLACFASTCLAQDDGETERRLAQAEQKLSAHELALKELEEESGIALVILFLFGLVLSMWAMNRQRSGCAWFILGIIPGINIIAGLVALSAENLHRKSVAKGE